MSALLLLALLPDTKFSSGRLVECELQRGHSKCDKAMAVCVIHSLLLTYHMLCLVS